MHTVPTNLVEWTQLREVLHGRRHAIADHWHKAIAQTNGASPATKLVELTEQAIALLFQEPFEHYQAEAIGASLAGLHNLHPAALGRTQEVLAQQLVEGLPADQIAPLLPRLAALLGGVATGFLQRARETILAEQEQARQALSTELQQAQEALRQAYDEMERQVQARTAELQAINRSLKREITERQRVEEALRESLALIELAKQEWEATADTLPQFVCLLDQRGRIIRANRTVEQWNLGRVREVRGRRVHELFHPGCTDPACYLAAFWQRAWEELAQGQPAECEAEDSILGRYLHIQVHPIVTQMKRAVEEEASFAVVSVYDITERKRAEEALRRAHDELEIRVQERTAELAKANEALQAEIIERQRMEDHLLRTERLAAMGRLAAALAHEINNPLQAIANNLELVLDFPLLEEERLECLRAAQLQVQRLRALADSVLYFARPPRVERQPTPVAKVVHDALALASKQPGYSGIRVRLNLPETLPPVLASSSQLAQVFLNLILNAIEAMPNGGELSISARVVGKQVEVAFTDSGPGIAPEAMSRIFEPFFTTKEDGTGLGLAISHSIIQRHGGSLTAHNAPGGGAVFTVTLPIAQSGRLHLAKG